MSQKRFQILSLDAGGLKGLFTASFLAEWEKHENTRIVDHFDLITGTSTGGIIAIALGLGFSAQDIRDLYLEEATTIFPSSALGELRHWVGVKYSSVGLRSALEKRFGAKRLGGSRSRLVIPAFSAKEQKIHLFKTPHHNRLRNDFKESAIDVAMATAAAPTYLDPFERESGLTLVDGGIWANNPVMIGVAECLGYLQQPQEAIAALRIATTEGVARMDKHPEKGGKVQLAAPVFDYMMRGQMESAASMAFHILGPDRYFQVNPEVADGEFELDRLSRNLMSLADSQWRRASSDLAERGFLDHKAAPYKPAYL
jgi:patatin-like phospholipase/acyl hydrolase